MMKKLSLFLSIIIFINCNQKQEIKPTTRDKKSTIPKAVNMVSLETFTDFPEEADGPGCYFATGKKKFEKEKYFFVSSLDTICFIKSKGHFVKLRLVSENNTDSIQHYLQKYESEDFQLNLDFKALPNNDEETSLFEGSMSIKHKNEPEQKTEIYGYCGC